MARAINWLIVHFSIALAVIRQEKRTSGFVKRQRALERQRWVEGDVVWDIPRSLWNGVMLLAAIVFGPMTFGWDAFAVFLVTAAVTLCTGHSVGFHRRLIHRSFDCPKWLARTVSGMSAPRFGGVFNLR